MCVCVYVCVCARLFVLRSNLACLCVCDRGREIPTGVCVRVCECARAFPYHPPTRPSSPVSAGFSDAQHTHPKSVWPCQSASHSAVAGAASTPALLCCLCVCVCVCVCMDDFFFPPLPSCIIWAAAAVTRQTRSRLVPQDQLISIWLGL